jgi:hypothetical protein
MAVHTQIENEKKKEGKGVREDNNSRSRTRREEKEGDGKAVSAAEGVECLKLNTYHGKSSCMALTGSMGLHI